MARNRKDAATATPKGLKTWAISKLKPDPRNARTHDEDQVTRIAASIAAFGFNNPILVSAAGDVIAGHARLEAARKLELERVPVVVLDHLDERARRAYLIADNRLAELSGWDHELLQVELEALALEGVTPEALGFTERELAELTDVEPASERGRDEAPEPPAEPRTKTGDLWILGDHRILCGDATDARSWKRLCEGDPERAQAVFTDPPYGISYEDTAGTSIRNDHKQGGALEELLSKAFRAAGAHARDDAAWYVWHAPSMRREFDRALAAAGLVELQMIVWAKPSPNLGRSHYQWSHEACYYASREGTQPAWFGGRDKGTVWRFSVSGSDAVSTVLGSGVEILAGDARLWVSAKGPGGGRRLRQVRLEETTAALIRTDEGEGTLWSVARDRDPEHPTQKPVELATRALRNSTEPGHVVLDAFGGSGSTLLAAEELGRVARLTELDPRWVDVACGRWAKATGRQPKLHGAKRTGKARRKS